jgi:hydrogenase expression/formation protein HypC
MTMMPITKRLGDRRMCLAIPMRIVSVEGYTACCEAKGIRREVSLTLLLGQEPTVGDHVLVHVGYALQTISAADARATWDLFDEIAAVLDHADA